MARDFISKTFTAASSDVANHLPIPFSRTEPEYRPTPLAAVFCTLDANASDTTLEAVLYNATGVVHRLSGTVAGSARRTALNNGSGGYIGLITWEVSGNNMIDLVGHSYEGCKWAVGVTDMGTPTEVTLHVAIEASESKVR